MYIEEVKQIPFKMGLVDLEQKYPVGVNWRKKIPDLDKWPEKYERTGACIFTGDVEIIDVDSKNWEGDEDFSEIFLQWIEDFTELVWYKTPSGGLHVPFRTEHAEGNMKLSTRNGKVLVETRGVGGLAVCPPSEGYVWQDATWEDVPTLSEERRAELLEVCRDFNEEAPEELVVEAKSYVENKGRAGDDWASKNSFVEYIKSQGWTIDKVMGETVLFRRPNKDKGTSASWNFGGSGRFFCWSSNAGLPTEKMLKPFAVKAYLEFDGDFKRCAMELRKAGYGNDAMTLVEACEHCENWGQVGLVLQENKDKVANLNSSEWNDLNFGLQAYSIKGVSESKLDKFKKSIVNNNDQEWEDKLTYDEDGKVKRRLYNIDLILNNAKPKGHDYYYRDLFFYDDFNQRIVIKRGDKIEEFDDGYMAMLRVRLAREFGEVSVPDLEAVITTIAKQNHFHPLQEKIKSIEWDGEKRLDSWLKICCGAKDTEYNRLVSRKWAVSAMARLFHAGCKVDNVMVLEGAQGAKKSTLLRILSYGNFLDGGIDIRTKDGIMSLFGKWIVEFSELEGLNGRTADAVKSFLGKQDDKIRLPYQKKEEYFKRTCVFAGTTNKKQYLNDPTGNRRFWPVGIEYCDLEKAKEVRDQVWAEAYIAFKDGEEWWVNEESEEAKLFRVEQGARLDRSEVEEVIDEYDADMVFDDGAIGIKLKNLWTNGFNGRLENLNRRKEHELAHSLRMLGFEKGVKIQKGVKFKGWLKS